MSSLLTRYEQSSAYWTDHNDAGWQDWFNPDIPGTLAYPSDTEFVVDLIAEMLEVGETYWSRPVWIRDLWSLFVLWADEEKLIRIRLYAEWLLPTLPESPIDVEMAQNIRLLAKGEFEPLLENKINIQRINIK